MSNKEYKVNIEEEFIFDENEGDKIVNEINEIVKNNKIKNELAIKRTLAGLVMGVSFFVSYNVFSYIKTEKYNFETYKQLKVDKVYEIYDAKEKKNYIFSEDTIKVLMVEKINLVNKIEEVNKINEIKNKYLDFVKSKNNENSYLGYFLYLEKFQSDDFFNKVNIFIKTDKKNKYKTKKIDINKEYLKDGLDDPILLDISNMSAKEIKDINIEDISNIKLEISNIKEVKND